jgi:tight adherence protein C
MLQLAVFLGSASSAVLLFRFLEKRRRAWLVLRRFDEGKPLPGTRRRRIAEAVLSRLARLGAGAVPKKEAERARIMTTLKRAGYGARRLPVLEIYFGARLSLALVCASLYLVWVSLTGWPGATGLLKLLLSFGAGYYLPAVLLRHRASKRARKIWEEVPDVLDLLRICIDAGLGLDKALYRVSREVRIIAPVFSGELNRYFLEVRSGLPRKEILENLAERNQVSALSAFVGILLQSSRLGTDISEALRVHAMSLRTERIQIAEEQGAKMAVKLVFPLIFLIMPALLIVVLGPAVVNLIERLGSFF